MKKNIVGAALLMCCVSGAFAADTAELKVIGKIVPGACTPTFAGGGVVDYGTIAADTLNKATSTALPAKPFSWAVSCSAPVKIYLSFTDNRTDSSGADAVSPIYAYGLGFQGTSKIGGYRILNPTAQATADGSAVDLIYRTLGSTGAWAKGGVNGPVGYANTYGNTYVHSFAKVGEIVPSAFKLYGGSFDIIAQIASSQVLDLTKPVDLDGLLTMTVNYL